MDFNSDARPQTTVNSALSVIDVIHLVRTYVRWWVVPAVVCAVLAAAYSLVAPRHWRATQALIIRPEAASVSDGRLGRFSDLSEMKTLQETILELAKSQSVVHETLREVGPPRRYGRPAQWPTQLDIEDFRECIDMRPPDGAEFGKTEVFYLSIRDTDRQRVSILVATLCRQLEQRMQEIRDQRAHGMVVELERTVDMADADLTKQIRSLSAFEAKIGADLAELRNLTADIGGQSEVSQELQSIEAERRANESRRAENVRLLKLLVAAQDDPGQLLATPSSLLKSQPAVAQLKKALVAAEVRTASLLGSRSESHPFVVAAREAEELLREQLHDEVAVAIRGLDVDVELNAEREQSLESKWKAGRQRGARLAEARAEYANLVASVADHTKLVEAARKNLADARARQAGARSASVISRIDGVEAGVRPDGPGRSVITAAGGFGGLVLGFGIVFLFAAPRSDVQSAVPFVPAAPVAKHPVATEPTPVKDVVPARSKKNVTTALKPQNKFGVFEGMTLDEAIRSVEQSFPHRNGW